MSGAGNQLHFRGALALPEDSEPSLIVDLRVEDEVVVIMQDDEELGVWDVEQVDAERLNGQKFRLQLGDDEVIFHARDRAGFAYTGLNAITAAKERLEERRNKVWYERLVESGDPINVKALVADARESVGRLGRALRNLMPEPSERPEPQASPPAEVEQSIAPSRETLAPTTTEVRGRRTRRRTPDAAEPEQEPRTAPPSAHIESPPAPQPPADSIEAKPPSASPTEIAPDDEFEPLEPWNLGPSAIPSAPSRKNRGRHRTPRRQADAANPWASVADDLLRKDPEPVVQPKRRLLRGHEHDFTKTALSGGLVRLVCECGEVVIKSDN